MSIQSLSLTKEIPVKNRLHHVAVSLGWFPDEDITEDFNVDISAFLLGDNGKIIDDRFFVFYNNLRSPDGAVWSGGDDAHLEDDTIFVDLTNVDGRVEEINFVGTIHEGAERQQSFGQMGGAFICINDQLSGEEICKYELGEDFSTESAVEFGRLYRKCGSWKFNAIGRGNNGGLEGLLAQYS